jgi:hypothetical protein|uniref:Uncharacterized protein n=1 Tax=viral metagenome TaxID=1070528 RepID=A0A6C0J4N0_9ZZZZ
MSELKKSYEKLSQKIHPEQTMLFATDSPQLEDRNPIVFIPASRLEFSTTNEYIPPHKYGICSTSGNLWATADASVPYFEDCFLDRFSVKLDNSGNIVNTTGVNVKVTTGKGGSEEGSFNSESYLLYVGNRCLSFGIYESFL